MLIHSLISITLLSLYVYCHNFELKFFLNDSYETNLQTNPAWFYSTMSRIFKHKSANTGRCFRRVVALAPRSELYRWYHLERCQCECP